MVKPYAGVLPRSTAVVRDTQQVITIHGTLRQCRTHASTTCSPTMLLIPANNVVRAMDRFSVTHLLAAGNTTPLDVLHAGRPSSGVPSSVDLGVRPESCHTKDVRFLVKHSGTGATHRAGCPLLVAAKAAYLAMFSTELTVLSSMEAKLGWQRGAKGGPGCWSKN